MTANRTCRLAARPTGMVVRETFSFATEEARAPGEGEVQVKVLYLSLDPAMRGWLNDARSYIPPVQLGEVMRALGAGVVTESRDQRFQPGDHVVGGFGVQEYAAGSVEALNLNKVDTRLAPLPTFIGALGMPGLTGYFGVLDVGALKDGETLVVSGAAGAVGQVVGQIGKIKNCRVIGIAGGPDKVRFAVDELGYDACIDYKSEDVGKRLRELAPGRIDVYFDNVGGEILDAALAHLNRGARVVVCGAISQYNNTTAVEGPKNYLSLLVNRARMEGFVVFDFAPRYGEAILQMAQWIGQGRFKHKEHVVPGGIDAFPETMNKLFTGENFGKLVLQVAEA